MTDLFLDESILSIEPKEGHPIWQVYFYGGVNIHANGIGAILISPTGAHYLVAIKLRFSYTNNIAKYKVYIVGLEAALDMNVKDLEVCGDSMFIINQFTGECLRENGE